MPTAHPPHLWPVHRRRGFIVPHFLRAPIVGLFALSLATAAWSGGTRYYVDADAVGGMRGNAAWMYAFPTLEQALAAAVSGDEIWIAEGVYRPPAPTRGVADPEATFSVPRGVRLVGGFTGVESDESEADPFANPTILSGDLETDDLDYTGDGLIEQPAHQRGTNARHLVTITGSSDVETSLRGLILTAGYSDDGNDTHTGPDDQGAAIDCGGAELRLEEVWMQGNHAERNAIIANCPDIEVFDSIFRDNRSYSLGTISQDSGTWERCVFEDQYALNGGSVFRTFNKTLTVLNSQFRYNINPPVEVFNGTVHFEGVVFTGNTGNPSAIEANGTASLSVVNSTFVGNWPFSDTGLIRAASVADVDVSNSIFWNNNSGFIDPEVATAVVNDGTGTVTVEHSIVQGSGGSTSWNLVDVGDGGGNLDENPLLVSVPSYTEAPFVREDDPNTHLTSGSPALDAGTNSAVTVSQDADGNPRISGVSRVTDEVVDIGAWEGVAEEAAISLTLSDGSGTAIPGAATEYTLVATNTESFPVGVRLKEDVPDEMTCTWELVPSEAADGGTVSGMVGLDHIQSLSAGAFVTGTGVCSIEPQLTGTVEARVTVQLTGDVPWVAATPDDVSDIDTLVPTANVTVSQISYPPGIFREKLEDTDEFYRGDEIIYSVSAINEGPSTDPAVRLQVQFPDAVEDCAALFCQVGDCTVGEGNSVDLMFQVPARELIPFGFQCTVREDAPFGPFSSTATVTPGDGMVGDDDLDNSVEEIDQLLDRQLFADGFEDGTTDAWSPATP